MIKQYTDREVIAEVVRRSNLLDGEYRIDLEQLRELSRDVRLTDAQYKVVVEYIKEGERLLEKSKPDGVLQEFSTGRGVWRYNG